MSCDDGDIQKGNDFKEVVSSSSGILRVRLNGVECPADINDLGGGNWSVAVDGNDIDQTGELQIQQQVGGSWVTIKCHKVI